MGPPSSAPKPHWITDIRILFYADSSSTNLLLPKPGVNLRGHEEEFGLRILKDILEASFSPNISVDLVNRFWTLNPSNGGVDSSTPPRTGGPNGNPTYLTSDLLSHYDEVWLFGKHLGNFHDDLNPLTPLQPEYEFVGAAPGTCLPQTNFPDDNGYWNSELGQDLGAGGDEVAALIDWMSKTGGGVLILGDHSNHPRYSHGPWTTGDLLNLGRAMGIQIPRAGKMRVWQGGGDSHYHLVNTSGDTGDMTCMEKQADAVPQDIEPVHGHPLFIGSMDLDGAPAIIRVMPDHGHEGSLDFPQVYDLSEWPKAANGYQPIPEVVASGNTKKTPFGGNLGFPGLPDPYLQPGRISLISAYDGHQAGVGRIVAHTSFHHFVNVNLNGFLNPDDGSPNGALQSISEYYRNLASWLMPPAQRTKSLHGMMQWLPSVMRDLSGAPLELLGTAALKGLGHYATGGQIQDLIFHAVEQVIPPTDERRTQQLPLPSLAYLLGGMVTEQQRNPNQDVVVKGIRRALRTRLEELEAGAEAMRDLLGGEREPREC